MDFCLFLDIYQDPKCPKRTTFSQCPGVTLRCVQRVLGNKCCVVGVLLEGLVRLLPLCVCSAVLVVWGTLRKATPTAVSGVPLLECVALGFLWISWFKWF